MALEVSALPRTFRFHTGATTMHLDDPNASLSAEQVRGFYSHAYPQLTSATVQGPQVDSKGETLVYEFRTNVGVKG